MFIKEICKQFGNHFTERTLVGQKKDKTYNITTIKKDNKPVAKKYEIHGSNSVIHIWKNLVKKTVHIDEIPKLDRYI